MARMRRRLAQWMRTKASRIDGACIIEVHGLTADEFRIVIEEHGGAMGAFVAAQVTQLRATERELEAVLAGRGRKA